MTREDLYLALLDRIGEAEFQRVESQIGSKTLREAMTLLVDANLGQAQLYIPHYWAEWYHDGRGPVQPVDAKVLVYFTNPADDPRIADGYPIRAKDVVRLTKDQWDEGLAINAERRKAGLPPYMIVVPSVGPAGPHPFFDELAVGAADRATAAVTEEMDVFIQNLVDTDRDLRAETDTASLSL